MKESSKRIFSIYTLRGVGAFIIAFFYHHYHFTSSHRSVFGGAYTAPLFKNGYLLVETFFMISGFVMALNYKEKILSGSLEFKDYILRRIKHLYPLFFITLVVAALEHLAYVRLYKETYDLYAVDLTRFIQNLLLVHMGWFSGKNSFNGPAWCIAVEMFCYIVFYLVCKWGKGHRSVFAVPAMIGLICVDKKWSYPLFGTKMGRGLSCFFIGVILNDLFAAYQKNKGRVKIHRINVLVLSALLLVAFGIWRYGLGWVGKLQMVYILFLGPAMLWLTVAEGPIRTVMEWKPFVTVGRWSMSIFLWNVPVQLLFMLADKKFSLHLDYWSLRFFAINMGSTLLTAFLSYEFIEKNSIRISDRALHFFVQDEGR